MFSILLYRLLAYFIDFTWPIPILTNKRRRRYWNGNWYIPDVAQNGVMYRDWRRREVDMDEAVRRPDGKPFHKAFGDTWVGENIALLHEENGRLG